jgi:hypothetical protein
MMAKEQAPNQKEQVREVTIRLGAALGARALWALIEWLFVHRGIDI